MNGFGQGLWGQLIGIIMFIVFMLFYQKIMVAQVLFKLERTAQMLEKMSSKAEKKILKKISKKPSKKLKKSINSFLEFFVISPVSLDPYGLVKKLEHVIDLQKDRFKYFVKQVAPDFDSEERANMVMGLSGTISLYQLTKQVRHFVELIKKTRSLNLAMLLKMQLPLIRRLAKALLKGSEAMANGWPVGDTIGAYVAADLIGKSKVKEVDEETLMSKKKYKKRKVIIIKAKGPGGRTGKPGRALEKVCKRRKVAKIITIDASMKLEGEKTGTIAEGVGVAIGGVGVEKSHIEEFAVEKEIPLDSIVIKMSKEEAITPMKKNIHKSLSKVKESIDRAIERTDEKGTIVIVGVGNTSGVGNNKKDLKKAEKIIKKNIKKMEKEKEKKEKKKFKLPFK